MNSMPLSAPNAQKIENFMMAHFGVLRSMITVPDVANFTARCKQKARGGSGSGTTLQFSGGWDELAVRLDAIQYFRNAIVHADSQKLAEIPQSLSALSSSLRSSMWAEKENSSWSLQMPHAVTAVRTAAAVFNTVAFTLYNAVGLDASDMAVLKPPDEVVPFNG
ncbi:MAG: hypothetical protein OXE79_03025 [Acidimicrobiaceae bacterium]|nr:hypothetical protein [Acidimicrobiaceae bacterium]